MMMNEPVKLPAYVVAALRKGLKLHKAGHSGDGLTQGTIDAAKRGVARGEWPASKILKSAAWLARHEADRESMIDPSSWDEPPGYSPAFVAWLLWGSDSDDKGRDWIDKTASKIKESESETYANDPSTPAPKKESNQYNQGVIDMSETKQAVAADGVDGVDVDGVDVAELARLDGEHSGDLHIMRVGDLYDLETGEALIPGGLTPEMAKMISQITNANIRNGHNLPISLEHGIEKAQGGGDGDRRPYGEITEVYYKDDENGGGIYGRKRWSKIGLEFVSAAMTDDGKTVLRTSPRVRFGPAFDPSTGASVGGYDADGEAIGAYIDVLALTTLPRQNNMYPVEMNRAHIEGDATLFSRWQIGERFDTIEDNETPETGETKISRKSVTNNEGAIMSKKTPNEAIDVLLARGSDEAVALFKAARIDEGDDVAALTNVVNETFAALELARTDLAAFREDEAKRKAEKREIEVDALLADHEFQTDDMRLFFRGALLGNDENAVNMARTALESRVAVDPLESFDAVVLAAKERGAIPADWDNSEIRELARTAPAVAEKMVAAFTDGATVRVGEPAGTAIIDEPVDRDEAAVELSRLAHEKAKADGVALAAALKIVKTDRPDLVGVIEGVQ